LTVITHVRREGGKLIVRGTSSDNGDLAKVVVNGKTATGVGEWQVVLDATEKGPVKLKAHAEDARGNIEKTPHEMTIVLR
jgi:hypothetical protein